MTVETFPKEKVYTEYQDKVDAVLDIVIGDRTSLVEVLGILEVAKLTALGLSAEGEQ